MSEHDSQFTSFTLIPFTVTINIIFTVNLLIALHLLNMKLRYMKHFYVSKVNTSLRQLLYSFSTQSWRFESHPL